MKLILHRSFVRRFHLYGLVVAALLTGGATLPAVETADGEAVKPPVPTKRVMPVHPIELQKKLINGQALGECLVTETGIVKEVKVVTASEPEFGLAAEEALWQWEFKPGEVAGLPVSMRLQVPFDFKITVEMLIESALKRKVFLEIKDLVIPASELPAWPRAMQILLPKYPESLKGSGKYGKAVVSFVINKEGKVLNPTIVKSTYPEFNLPALATAARLEFPPQVMANGEHIYVSMIVQFDFKADSDKPAAKEKPRKK